MDNEQKKYREVKKLLDILSYLWYNVFVKGAGMEMLKTSDVAKLLSVSYEQARLLVHRHGLPCCQRRRKTPAFRHGECQQV